LNTAATRDKQ